jgi:NADH dehydrogenase
MAHPSMLITILGGSGFVGSELIARLIRSGHRVRLLTRGSRAPAHLAVLPNLDFRRVNVHDETALRREFSGSDVVINLVGILNEHGFSGRGFQLAHAELARKVVAACVASQVPRLLHMSSFGAGPNAPSFYLQSKGLAEQHVRAAPAALAWTIFRPSVIFGAHDSLLNRFAQLLPLSRGWIPLARAATRFAPVWVSDVAAAFERALIDPATIGHSFDLGGPETLTLKELVELAGKLSGTPAKAIALPDFIGRLQAAILDFVPGKPFSSDNFRSLQLDNAPTTSGLQALGITPISLSTIAPTYLGAARQDQNRYAAFRRQAGRYGTMRE